MRSADAGAFAGARANALRTKIYLEGSLQYRTYKDKQNKEQRSAVVIVNRSGPCARDPGISV